MTADRQPSESERLVGARYRLRRRIGAGGMGTVWPAHDELLNRAVAVKEVTLPPGGDPAHRAALGERLMREARTAAAIDHPNAVRVYDVADDGGRPWIVMELLTGRTLDAAVGEDGPCRRRRSRGSDWPCSTRSRRRTGWACCTGTSNPRTCSCATTGGSSSPTLVSPGRPATRR